MDTPRGLQLSKDMLPVIQKFEPGQFIVFFLHPGVSTKVWEQYSAEIARQVKGLPVGLFGMQDLGATQRVPTLSLEQERESIRNLRVTAVRNGTIGILVYQFPKRFSVVEMEADTSFHIFPGVRDSLNIQLGKHRSATAPDRTAAVQTLCYQYREEPPARPSRPIDVKDAITVEVRGGPRSGATLVSAMIARLLSEKLSVDGKEVLVISAEGDFPSRYEATMPGNVASSPFVVTAPRVIVHDLAMSPRPPAVGEHAKFYKVDPPMPVHTKTTRIDGEICTSSVPKGEHDEMFLVPNKTLTEL